MKHSERQFVDLLRRRARTLYRAAHDTLSLRQGIGDDCAVLRCTRRSDLLVTTDLFLEGTHFRRHWQPPASRGHKALARSLSDIAAMGGVPRFAFLSLAFPRNLEEKWINAFLDGFLRLAREHKVVLAGGDTSASPGGLLADVAVLGTVPRNSAILRSGARPGDHLFVSGTLGGAGLALRRLRGGRIAPSATGLRPFLYPQPRLAIGTFLRSRKLASAMIDLSDGLSIDLWRLCAASRVGAQIDAHAVPRLPGVPMELALHGGEDHELLFAVPPNRASRLPARIAGVPITRIGLVTRGRALLVVRDGRAVSLPVRGFEHF